MSCTIPFKPSVIFWNHCIGGITAMSYLHNKQDNVGNKYSDDSLSPPFVINLIYISTCISCQFLYWNKWTVIDLMEMFLECNLSLLSKYPHQNLPHLATIIDCQNYTNKLQLNWDVKQLSLGDSLQTNGRSSWHCWYHHPAYTWLSNCIFIIKLQGNLNHHLRTISM